MRGKVLAGILALLLLSVPAFAHDEEYDVNNQSFREGYRAGFYHGSADRQAGLEFNYRHSEEYQRAESGDPEHRSFESSSQLSFRLGYVEGYTDGFHRQRPRFGNFEDDDDHEDNDRYRDEGYRGNDDDDDDDFRRHGITVYTEPGYDGTSQQFELGKYRYLDGRLNDAIESIRMDGNVRVVLFDLSDFRGQRVVIDRDAYDLGGFRRKAASMIIEPISYGSLR